MPGDSCELDLQRHFGPAGGLNLLREPPFTFPLCEIPLRFCSVIHQEK